MSKLAKVLFLCAAISLTTLTCAKGASQSEVPTVEELKKKLFAVEERIEKLTVLKHMYRGQLNLLKQIEEEKETKTKTKSKKSKEKTK